jgi:hypothetical protein
MGIHLTHQMPTPINNCGILFAQHAHEDHHTGWSKVKILQIKSNSRHRKYKEAAHMACLTDPISQSSLEVSSIWIPLTEKEVNR